jgi:glycosyltransferase involved in cell wall biosynthesis
MGTMGMIPKVTVIITLYNYQDYISDAVKSLYDQSFTDWRALIINDGSIDNSLQIAKSFENDKITVFDFPNQRLCKARYEGLTRAESDYICFLDADDMLASWYLEKTVEALDNTEHCIAVTDEQHFGLSTKKFLKERISMKQIRGHSGIPVPSLFRKKCWDKIVKLGYQPDWANDKVGGEDWDFWLFLYESCCSAARVPGFGILYREHDSNASKNVNMDCFSAIKIRHQSLYSKQEVERAINNIKKQFPEELEKPWLKRFL